MRHFLRTRFGFPFLFVAFVILSPPVTSFTRIVNVTDLQEKLLSVLETSNKTFINKVIFVQLSLCRNAGHCSGNVSNISQPSADAIREEVVNLGGCCLPCSCDKDCKTKGTCCPDFTSVSNETAGSAGKQCSKPNRWSNNKDTLLSEARMEIPSVAMVTSCPVVSGKPSYWESKCAEQESSFSMNSIPQTSKRTGNTYRNKICALCHGDVIGLELWQPVIHLPQSINIFVESTSLTRTIQSISEGKILNESSGGIVTLRPPPVVANFVLRDVCVEDGNTTIKICNVTGLWKFFNSFIVQACSHYEQHYRINGLRFGNVFCMLCNLDVINMTQQETCDVTFDPHFPIPHIYGLISVAAYEKSLSKMTKLSPRSRWMLPPSVNECDCIRDPLTSSCRPIFCPPGDVPVACACVPVLYDLSGLPLSVTIKVTLDETGVPLNETLESFGTDVCSKVSERSTHNNDVIVLQSYAFVKNTTRPDYFLCVFTMVTKKGGDTRLVFQAYLDNLDFFISLYTKQGTYPVQRFKPEAVVGFKICNHDNGPSSVIDSSDGRPLILLNTNNSLLRLNTQFSKLFSCKQFEFAEGDYSFINQALVRIRVSGDLIKEFLQLGNRVRVCVEDYLKAGPINVPKSVPRKTSVEDKTFEGILSFISMLISIVFGIYTVLTYLLFKVLRNIPGLCNMCLSIHIVCAQLLFIFGFDQTGTPSVCEAIGISMHFFWLSSVLWMQACCVHMYRSFAGDLRDRIVDNNCNTKLVISYAVYCWLVAGLIVAANIFTSYIWYNDVGYGKTHCYISRPEMVGCFFVLPVGIVLIINMAMFITVVVVIHRQSHRTMAMISRKNGILVYVKLSSITGITWAFGYLYIWTNVSFFEHLFIAFNGGQCVFVALSFVMSPNIRNHWRNLLGCPKKLEGSGSSQEPRNNIFIVNSSM